MTHQFTTTMNYLTKRFDREMKMNRYFSRLMASLMLSVSLFSPPLTSEAYAENEISRLVPFQGRLHDGAGQVVSDGVYDLTFSAYDTPTGGTAVWSENHSQVSVIHGYVNVLLGAINPLDEAGYATQEPLYDSNSTLVDFTEKKYLGISINGGAEMFPRSQLVPSFHAYTANHADHATQADQATNSDKLGGVSAESYALISHVSDVVTQSIAEVTGTIDSLFTSGKANDADLLDGKDAGEFVEKSDFDPSIYGRKIVRVEGDSHTYYPVYISAQGAGYGFEEVHISRGYSWSAPTAWANSSTHKGGLTLSVLWSGDSGWGGNQHYLRVIDFHQTYSGMVARMEYLKEGLTVWLRGGGADYAFHTPRGANTNIVVTLGNLTDRDNTVYSPITVSQVPEAAQANYVPNKIANSWPIRHDDEIYDQGILLRDKYLGKGATAVNAAKLGDIAAASYPVLTKSSNNFTGALYEQNGKRVYSTDSVGEKETGSKNESGWKYYRRYPDGFTEGWIYFDVTGEGTTDVPLGVTFTHYGVVTISLSDLGDEGHPGGGSSEGITARFISGTKVRVGNRFDGATRVAIHVSGWTNGL